MVTKRTLFKKKKKKIFYIKSSGMKIEYRTEVKSKNNATKQLN